MENRKVISFKDLGVAEEDSPWKGPSEISAAEVDELRVMCTWYDVEDGENKSAYKLPHHRTAGQHQLVWRGLTAAMGALLGARGGLAIPAGDKPGVYSHLAKHYKAFNKTPPELRDYLQGELKQMFPEMYDVKEEEESSRTVRVVIPHIRVIENTSRSVEDVSSQAIDDAFDKLRGRV